MNQGREKTNPTKGNRPPLSTDREGFREGRGCDLDRLERGTGGQGWGWRLTERSLGREVGEKRGRGLLGVDDSLESV